MTTGISFDNLQEAREYQRKMIQTEQVASNIRREGNRYMVTLLERKPVKIFNVPQKEMEKHLGREATGFHKERGGEHGVWFTKDTSTKTKLHEIGHARHGHANIGGVTFGDRIDRELDAEIYAYLAMGKELTPHVAVDAISQAYTWRPRMNWVSVINAVANKLEERGIQVTKEDKEWLFDTTLSKTDDPELEEWKESLRKEF